MYHIIVMATGNMCRKFGEI